MIDQNKLGLGVGVLIFLLLIVIWIGSRKKLQIYAELIHYGDYLIGINPAPNRIQLVEVLSSDDSLWRNLELKWKASQKDKPHEPRRPGSAEWIDVRSAIMNISPSLTESKQKQVLIDNCLLKWMDSLDGYQYADPSTYDSIKSSALSVSIAISMPNPN